jgi:hypothetical protein
MWKTVHASDFSVCYGIKIASQPGVMFIMSRTSVADGMSLNYIFQGCTWNLDECDQLNHK